MKAPSDPLVVLALVATFFVVLARFDGGLVTFAAYPVLGGIAAFISVWYSGRERDQIPKRYRWLLEKFNL